MTTAFGSEQTRDVTGKFNSHHRTTRFDGGKVTAAVFFVILLDGTTGVGNTSSARIEAMRLVPYGQTSPCKHVSSPPDLSRRPKEVATIRVRFRVFFFTTGC